MNKNYFLMFVLIPGMLFSLPETILIKNDSLYDIDVRYTPDSFRGTSQGVTVFVLRSGSKPLVLPYSYVDRPIDFYTHGKWRSMISIPYSLNDVIKQEAFESNERDKVIIISISGNQLKWFVNTFRAQNESDFQLPSIDFEKLVRDPLSILALPASARGKDIIYFTKLAPDSPDWRFIFNYTEDGYKSLTSQDFLTFFNRFDSVQKTLLDLENALYQKSGGASYFNVQELRRAITRAFEWKLQEIQKDMQMQKPEAANLYTQTKAYLAGMTDSAYEAVKKAYDAFAQVKSKPSSSSSSSSSSSFSQPVVQANLTYQKALDILGLSTQPSVDQIQNAYEGISNPDSRQKEAYNIVIGGLRNDAFKTLGLSPNVSLSEIRKTYLVLAKQYHPDKNKAPGAAEMFKKIDAAYKLLTKDYEFKEQGK